MKPVSSCWLAVFFGGIVQAAALQPSDLSRLEGLGQAFGGPVSIHRESGMLAITRHRTLEGERSPRQYYAPNDRADIWVRLNDSSPLRRITDGRPDSSGWFAPSWSPDGQYLAITSTRGSGDGGLWLWVWDRISGELRQIGRRAILPGPGSIYRPAHWIGGRKLLAYVTTGEGALAEDNPQKAAIEGWKLQREGQTPSMSLLDSPEPSSAQRKISAALVLFDLASGGQTELLKADVHHIQVSARGYVAAVVANERGFELRLFDGAGTPIVHPSWGTLSLTLTSLTLSPDGQRVAYVDASAAPRLRVVEIDLTARKRRNHAVESLALPGSMIGMESQIWAKPLRWWGQERWLVQTCAAASSQSDRQDWWIVGGGAPIGLTQRFAVSPKDVVMMNGGSTLVFTAASQLWVGDKPGTANLRSLGTAEAIEWPRRDVDRFLALEDAPFYKPGSDVFVREHNLPQAITIINVVTAKRERISTAADRVDVLDVFTDGSPLLYSSGSNGFDVSIAKREFVKLFSGNEFFSTLDRAKIRWVHYRSWDGKSLRAAVLLPADFAVGKKYPTITWVYPGQDFTDSMGNEELDLTHLNFMSPQFAVGAGYAVLLPSMPRDTLKEGNPFDDIAGNVLPAVDAAMREGYLDERRSFLLGHSFGGYAALALVAQSHQFSAAASIAAATDLSSLYGTFVAHERYGSVSPLRMGITDIVESGQIRMRVPPYEDYFRYLRNSPIAYVTEINTPVLLIQGDLDHVAVQQGEEMFTLLSRLGKRARFVRYWGEEHHILSPANVVDMWEQIFSWFERTDGR